MCCCALVHQQEWIVCSTLDSRACVCHRLCVAYHKLRSLSKCHNILLWCKNLHKMVKIQVNHESSTWMIRDVLRFTQVYTCRGAGNVHTACRHLFSNSMAEFGVHMLVSGADQPWWVSNKENNTVKEALPVKTLWPSIKELIWGVAPLKSYIYARWS